MARADLDRAHAGEILRAAEPGAEHAPSFRLWRSSVTVDELTSTVARYLGEERTRSFESFASARASASIRRRGRFPAPALRRAPARLRHRRGLLAARAVAAAAQAHGLDQGGAQAARRRQRRHPLQSRNPADRARPRAPGHRGLRQGSAAGVLEPAVRRDSRSAAGADPRRRIARRDRALQRRAGRARTGPGRRAGRERSALRHRHRAVPEALRPARPRGRGPHQPHAGRRHRHHRHRHHRASPPPRRWSAPTRRWKCACASAPPS
jgi:hypothetical protein